MSGIESVEVPLRVNPIEEHKKVEDRVEDDDDEESSEEEKEELHNVYVEEELKEDVNSNQLNRPESPGKYSEPKLALNFGLPSNSAFHCMNL